MNKVLVIAAHPDDELLGVGGTIHKLTQAGSVAEAIIACSGNLLREQTHENHGSIKEDAYKAAKIAGYSKLHFLDYNDQHLDTVPILSITQKIEAIVCDYKPDTVFLQFGGDINNDHKVLFNAALVSVRPLNKFIQSVYAFETLSSTEWGYPREFKADTYVDITEHINAKCCAMRQYKTELCKPPHPRSELTIRAAARSHGSTINCEYAERFQTIWRIQR